VAGGAELAAAADSDAAAAPPPPPLPPLPPKRAGAGAAEAAEAEVRAGAGAVVEPRAAGSKVAAVASGLGDGGGSSVPSSAVGRPRSTCKRARTQSALHRHKTRTESRAGVHTPMSCRAARCRRSWPTEHYKPTQHKETTRDDAASTPSTHTLKRANTKFSTSHKHTETKIQMCTAEDKKAE
jgi:hypothetical protein